jgi:hypothetical protein
LFVLLLGGGIRKPTAFEIRRCVIVACDGYFPDDGPLAVVLGLVDMMGKAGFGQPGAEVSGKFTPCPVLIFGTLEKELDLDAESEGVCLSHGNLGSAELKE